MSISEKSRQMQAAAVEGVAAAFDLDRHRVRELLMAALLDDGTVRGVVYTRYGALHMDVVDAVLTILAAVDALRRQLNEARLEVDGDVEALDARARLVLTIEDRLKAMSRTVELFDLS